jgi:hypothetical protein
MSQRMHGLFSVLAVLFASISVAEETPKKLSQEQIAKLIEQLGNSDFEVRESANRQLREMEEALPALRRAAQSSDLEVRRRAKEVVAVLEKRLSERFLRQAVTRVNEEGLDLFIDRMVLQKDYANEARWKAFVELARALSKQAEKFGATVPNVLEQNWLSMGETTTFARGGLHGARVRVDGIEGTINSIHNCLFVSSGSLEGTNSVFNSLLFVDGDIKSLNSTRNSILICSGTIKSFNSTRNCLIFCNGDINQMNHAEGNAIFIRGELRSLNYTVNNVLAAGKFGGDNFSQGNTFLNRKDRNARNGLRRGNGPADKYVAADPSPLTLFQFFEPARVGLAHSMIEGDARIDKLTAGKPFAQAGLRKDDRIMAVDRTKFVAADAFSKLLRRRIVAGKALLKVQRGDRVLEIPVAFEP